MRDDALMRKALALAARGAGSTSPNPMVGAIIAGADGAIVAEGYHERAGSPHAETMALERAGPEARGATLYVTLEPCDHQASTPPCTQAILQAGVARVVIAAVDDDERVRGAGIARLRAGGVQVDVGVLEAAARHLNRRYAHHRMTGRPFVTLKMAQSIDGAAAARPGERTQLTGAKAAAHVRRLRFEHDAVMIGVATAIVDDPRLTVRPFKQRAVPYVRIVADSSARLPSKSQLVKDQRKARTIVAVTDRAPKERVDDLARRGVQILTCAADASGLVDLRDLLRRLGSRGMLGVLCEGGPTLATTLLEADLVDELHWIVAPIAFGSGDAVPALRGFQKPVKFTIDDVRQLGEDALIVARPAR